MEIEASKQAMQARALAWRREGRRLGLVPTMGALHAGHLSLVERIRDACDHCIASVFVNPLQFGPQEDLDRYPRDLEGDARKLEAAGCDLLFAPDAATMYGDGILTQVEVREMDAVLCGASRPGHFRGVATVVTKLFHLVLPDVAAFGLKDAQQALLLRRMVRDLDFPVRLVFGPTVRDPDGLALSSRNAYLSPEERAIALRIPRSLQAARARVEAGERNVAAVRSAARAILESGPGLQVDYVEVVDVDRLRPLERLQGPVLLAVAARVGSTRLIDNVMFRVEGDAVRDYAPEG